MQRRGVVAIHYATDRGDTPAFALKVPCNVYTGLLDARATAIVLIQHVMPRKAMTQGYQAYVG
jgi:hypothetical protein